MAFVPYIRYLEHIYRFTYFPFALYSPFTRWCGGCADRVKLHRSASLHSRAARERGSHARLPMVALRWLGCLTLSVSGYAHTYSSIALYLYSLITLLLYSLIMVFIYCYTHLLGYCRIRIFYYCSSYLLLAIRQ